MSQSSSEIVNHVLQLVTERNAEGDVLIAQESQLGLKCSGGELSEYSDLVTLSWRASDRWRPNWYQLFRIITANRPS